MNKRQRFESPEARWFRMLRQWNRPAIWSELRRPMPNGKMPGGHD